MVIEIHSNEVHSAPLPSATVMLLRNSALGPEVLMMRRHGNSNVLGGVHVFPGGKLDDADGEIAEHFFDQTLPHLLQALQQDDLDAKTAAALYVTALRETFEECGLLLCDGVAPELLDEARALLRAGKGFMGVLQQLALPLQTRHLAPWSRWITPRVASLTHKRFDTRFFVAQAPQDQEALHDDHEATETVWLSPAEALRQYWDSQIEMAPPQILTLSQLAHFDSVAAILAAARSRRPALIEPSPFDQDGQRVICYPGDSRHPVAERAWPGPTRLTFRNARFEPEGGLAALLPEPSQWPRR
jgi:8-oxo-dGTP pyrophosphatase MutT (NUDIX family)